MRRGMVGMVLALAGCFADAPDVAGSSTGGTAECPVGSKGCPCTGGGACDAPLECHAQSMNCYDPECSPGSANCPCANGLCLEGLECVEGYCATPLSTTGSASAESATAGSDEGTTTGTMSTTLSTTVVDDGTVSASSTDATMTSTVGSSSVTATSASTTLDGGSPMPCEECLLMQDSYCAMTYQTCEDDLGCHNGLDCIATGQSASSCCVVVSDGGLWNDFVNCAFAMCMTECEGQLITCPTKT